MIKKVFQIADIHIPNSLDNRPYDKMLKKFLSALYSEVKKYDSEEIRIVLCGDIFHQKIKTTNEAKRMFHEMLNYLNEMGQTLVFAGNHDMLENNTDRVDSITPTFEIDNVYPNITYADKELDYRSGIIEDENVVWVLYSMHDKFEAPDLSNIRSEYPEHKVIGLYHGEVVGAVTDLGRMSESGIDTKNFSECDCVMAGHIHKFQEIKKNGVPIVYSGSLFQQDAGENVSMHGFVEWDLETMKYRHISVDNDYNIYKFSIGSYDDIKEDKEKLLNL